MRTPVHHSFTPIHSYAVSLILTLLIAPSIIAQSQITTGTIDGRVVDANGALVPGANVEIRNLDTNFTRNLITNDEGRFVAPQLQPGKYSVSVAKQGFGTAKVELAELTVGQTLAITFPLSPSNVEGTVTVTTTPTIDTAKTQVSTT